jgi:hypothetical protein
VHYEYVSDVTHDLPGEADALPRMLRSSWLERAVRAIAIVVLLLAAATVLLSLSPAWASADAFTGDLAAGRVDYVEYDQQSRTIYWITDQFRWHAADVPAPLVPGGSDGHQTSGQEQAWIEQQLAVSGHPVAVAYVDNNGPREWIARVPWAPLRYATIAVWLLTLVHMLAAGGHRVANRWAWFWMFTIGQVGALLYLLREPVWRAELPDTQPAPIRGGAGFLYAVLYTFVVGALSIAASYALR